MALVSLLKKLFYKKAPKVTPTATAWDASLAPPARSQALFDMDKLGIPREHRKMFRAVNIAVRDYMYRDCFDPSHDYEHIQRVVTLAHRLYTAELARTPRAKGRDGREWITLVDPVKVYVGAMLHDVGEPKYLRDTETSEQFIAKMMKQCDVPTPIARYIEHLIPRVSFSREDANPELVARECEDYPELRIIQDADRLDALGAIGQGRCFVFGGFIEQRRKQTIHVAVQLQRSRFQRSVELMKTVVGREEAEKRMAEMVRFRREWNEETDVSLVC
ncbi:hypothetical protein CC80DRAFT_488705 [Byssothecium circinans]|uniref:HD/PDEase domain-containing protein n=1 Tax=Byssothecium circinans TaxID=147558 RepID=A0A6A5UK29_9PLEO|nr:hypothetical protein CC80DRAFT_488705 [Byssothecium circinans]